MRRNILISSEMIRAQSGEAAQLLSKLNKLDRNSSNARKIRRQLRRLGVRLSVSTKKQKHIKKSLRTPLLTRKQVERKRRKLGLEVKRTDQVLDTAQQLVLAGYKLDKKIASRLLELYPKIDGERAIVAARSALFKKNPWRKISKGGLESVVKSMSDLELSQKAEFLRKRFRKDTKESLLLNLIIIEMSKRGLLGKNPKRRRKYFTEFKRTVARHALRRNPPSGAKEIYSKILSIEAQKGPNSNYPKENFRHDFKPGAKIFGLPDGSILIKGKKRLWNEFKA